MENINNVELVLSEQIENALTCAMKHVTKEEAYAYKNLLEMLKNKEISIKLGR